MSKPPGIKIFLERVVSKKLLIKIRTLLLKFLAVVAILLIFILIIEGFSRVFLINAQSLNVNGYNSSGYGDLLPNKNFVDESVPTMPYRVVTNSQGLRNDKDFKLPKPANIFRILAVGDSFTYGPYVPNQLTYPEYLDNYLHEKNVNSEVINAGVSGYTLEDELSYVSEKGIKLEPDLIIVGVYQNDVTDYLPSRRKIFSRASHKPKSALVAIATNLAKSSAFITYLQERIAAIKYRSVNKDVLNAVQNNGLSKELGQYYADLDKLEVFAKSHYKARLLLVLIPSYDQVTGQDRFPQEQILEKAKSRFQVVDMLPYFKGQQYEKDLYLMPVNEHLSPFGNSVLASNVANVIETTLLSPGQ